MCRWLWYPLALAALNQSPEVASASMFVTVLRLLFRGDPQNAAVAVPAAPLEELYAAPARIFIEQRGGRVLTSSRARVALDERGSIAGVTIGRELVSAPLVISAVAWHAFSDLWEHECPFALLPICAAAARITSSPIVTANLWLDEPIDIGERFVGLIDRPMHWVFDKEKIFGGDARHMALVASGATALAAADNDQVAAAAMADLCDAFPAARNRSVLRSIVVRERRATFSLAEDQPVRPSTDTPLPNFYIAGDWIATGLPATIESAVISGHRAADRVLARFKASATPSGSTAA
jgi:hypothetical protein